MLIGLCICSKQNNNIYHEGCKNIWILLLFEEFYQMSSLFFYLAFSEVCDCIFVWLCNICTLSQNNPYSYRNHDLANWCLITRTRIMWVSRENILITLKEISAFFPVDGLAPESSGTDANNDDKVCVPIHVEMLAILQMKNLTHWGRVTHICVCKLTIIGSDNGLLPEWRPSH